MASVGSPTSNSPTSSRSPRPPRTKYPHRPIIATSGRITGAILATIAMMLPAAMLVYLVSRVWERAKDMPLRKAIEKGSPRSPSASSSPAVGS